jgi:PAS domain S-box-containing protein
VSRDGERREEVLTKLHEATRSLMRASDRTTIGEIVIETCEEVLGLGIALLAVVDEETEELYPLVTSDRAEAVLPPLEGLRYGPGSLPWQLFQSEEAHAFVDIGEHLPEVDDRVGTAVLVPMGEHGLLAVGSSDARELDASDVDFVKTLAANAETAIERARREERLREEHSRITALFQNTSDAIVEVSYASIEEPVVEAVNPAFERTFGFDREEVVGEPVVDVLVPPERREHVREWLEQFQQEGGQQYETEVQRQTAEGLRDFLLRAVSVDHSGIGYAIYTDITDRVAYARTLDQLHETTRELVQAGSPEEVSQITIDAAEDILGFPMNGVRLYDADRGTLVPAAMTAETVETLGERPEYGPGDGIVWEAFESQETKVVRQTDEHGLGEVPSGVESAIYLPLGRRGTLSIGARTTHHFDEVDVRLAEVLAANARVALERADREAQLKQREEELARQNDRLEQFASVVSHDLRNPLSVAQGYLDLFAELCADDLPDDDDRLAHLERVERAHRRMDRLIGDLLALARQGNAVGETEPVELGVVARTAWQTVDTAAATLSVEDDGTFTADRDRVVELFENLFRNAITHGGTDVSVTVGTTASGFYVEDDGVGIPPDERDGVFEHGYTTDSEGTGFGLAIVQEIVTAHDWAIAAVEPTGTGARFEVDGVDWTSNS